MKEKKFFLGCNFFKMADRRRNALLPRCINTLLLIAVALSHVSMIQCQSSRRHYSKEVSSTNSLDTPDPILFESAIAQVFKAVASGTTKSHTRDYFPPSSTRNPSTPVSNTLYAVEKSTKNPFTLPSTTTTTTNNPTTAFNKKYDSSHRGESSHDRGGYLVGNINEDRSGINNPMIQDSAYTPDVALNLQTPMLNQKLPNLELNNNLYEDNYRTERIYKHADETSSYLHQNNNNNKQDDFYIRRNNNNQIATDDTEIVDYAWVIHVYLTGVLMGVVAAMAICCIARIHFCADFFPRKFYITMHVLVFCAAFLRCILLFNGSFGEANSKLPRVLTGLLINSVPPFLTAAFALVLLVFLNGTNLMLIPAKYQSTFVLAVISTVHILSSITVDICAVLSDTESVINALRAGVQAITAGWGLLLCLGFITLITHLWKNEEKRVSLPNKTLKVIYVAVAVELILSCFTIFGIVTPRDTKSINDDNTWSLWILASCERLLEAVFCVTLLIITTTFTLNRDSSTKTSDQRSYGTKRDGVLKRSANIYPVTSDKNGFLPNVLFNRNLEEEIGQKGENIYSGWDAKYGGTIDSTTSDFQLLSNNCNSTISTVCYPHYTNVNCPENGEENNKDSYASHGVDSSTTSYSTLSSYRQMHHQGNNVCYCAPQCCNKNQIIATHHGLQPKGNVMLVSQYTHPQLATANTTSANPVPLSEESSGSSYYGSSLASSHIYSSPQYYACARTDLTDIVNNSSVHVQQCSELNPIQMRRNVDQHRHVQAASLPIITDITEINKRMIQQQHRPRQPLPPHELHMIQQQQHDHIQQQQQQQHDHIQQQQQHDHQKKHLHPTHSVITTTRQQSDNISSSVAADSTVAISNDGKMLPPGGASVGHTNCNNQRITATGCNGSGFFLNKLPSGRAPEGQIVSASAYIDDERVTKMPADNSVVTGNHMALNDDSLHSQIV